MSVTWILLSNSGQPEVVDQIDKLQMSWQKSFQQLNTPFFKSFWQNCMVGVWKRIVNDVPCGLLIQVLLIDHDSQQFDDTQGWMSIIQLDSSFIREVFPIEFTLVFLAVAFMSTNDILDGGWNQKILLFQTQLFSLFCGIVWIQNACDVLGLLTGFQSLVIIAAVEGNKIEFIDWDWFPKSETDRVKGSITWDWCIVGSGQDSLSFFPIWSFITLVINSLSNLTSEMDFVLDIDSFNLPGVTVLKPIVRDLNLASVFDDLSENTVLISDTVAPCRIVEGCHWVQKACGQSAQTTVSKSWIDFLIGNSFERITQILKGFFVLFFQVKIGESIGETSTDQELQRQIVNFLFAWAVEDPMAIVEAFNESVSNGMCHSQVAVKRLEIESGSGQCVLYVVDDTTNQGKQNTSFGWTRCPLACS